MERFKGEAGYIRKQKRFLTFKTVVQFGIVAALLILGITQTESRLNLLTVVAILGCLPAAKSLVQLIVIFPHHTIAKDKAEELEVKASLLTRSYDMVVTDEKKFMPIESLVILDNTICGYTASAKVDLNHLNKHIKDILIQNQYDKVSVKIFNDYTAYITRAEGMQNMAAVSRPDTKKREEGIKHIILLISL